MLGMNDERLELMMMNHISIDGIGLGLRGGGGTNWAELARSLPTLQCSMPMVQLRNKAIGHSHPHAH